jgi:hypothetical protein
VRATQSVIRTIDSLTRELRGQLYEGNQVKWDNSSVAARARREMCGEAGRPENDERVGLLLNDRPGADDECDGMWHLAAVKAA